MVLDLLQNKKISQNRNKKIFKNVFKWLKMLLYMMLIFCAFYGCFQQYIDTRVTTYSSPGGGFEICHNNANCYSNHIIIENTGDGKFYEIYYNSLGSNWLASWSYGPFYALFVWPFSQLSSLIMDFVKVQGLDVIVTIFIVVVLIRSTALLFTVKQIRQNLVMQRLQIKTSEIKAKYDGQKDMVSKQKQQAEIMALYKKHNIKPMASFGIMFVTMPLFYAMYRVFSTSRLIKEGYLFGNATHPFFSMSLSPFTAIATYQEWQYLIIILLVAPVQIVSFKIPQWLNNTRKKMKLMDEKMKKNYKRTMMMTNIMMIFFCFIAVSVPVSLGFYWFFSGLFSCGQTYAVYLYQKRKRLKQKLTKA